MAVGPRKADILLQRADAVGAAPVITFHRRQTRVRSIST